MPLTKIISTRWPSHLEIPPSRLPIVPVDKQQHQWPLSWEGPAIASATLLVSQGRGQIFLTDGWTIPNAGWNWMEKKQNTFGRTKRHAKSRTFHGHLFHSIPTWSDFYRPKKVKSSPLFTQQFMKIHDSYRRRLGWQLPNTIVLPVLHHSSPLRWGHLQCLWLSGIRSSKVSEGSQAHHTHARH